MDKAMLELMAKSKPNETIREHTDKVLNSFEKLMELYGDSFSEIQRKIIRTACEFHDYGKAIYTFQLQIGNDEYINSLPPEQKKALKMSFENEKYKYFPHGYISPAFLRYEKLVEDYGNYYAKLLVNAVFFHHNREIADDREIAEIVNNDLKLRFPDIAGELSLKYRSKIYKTAGSADEGYEAEWVDYAVVLGILNRCDYHASSNSQIPIEISPYKDGKGVGEIVETKLVEKYRTLRSVQEYMKQHINENLVVIASTGIGKTEAALMWGTGSKLFYTLPLKVAINSIYKRITEGYDYGKERTALLHSDAFAYLCDSEEDIDFAKLKYGASRILSYPVTVCTIDQLFTFVYKYRGCEMLLATLKYSKLIIDEIQSYSPEVIAKIIYGLKLITMCGGMFAIVTATLPPVLEYYMKRSGITYTKPEKPFLSKQKPRHFIKLEQGEFDIDRILEDGKTKKVLVICNTVAKAQEMYRRLSAARPFLLHSHFIKKHRDRLEEEILSFAGNNKNSQNNDAGIWVSTQIVEASLDIDFDMLYTEMSTADSFLQRLGRCWRSRTYSGIVPNVYVYNTGNGVGSVYDSEIYQRSVDALQKYSGAIFHEAEKIEYINEVYDVQALKGTKYYDKIGGEICSCENLTAAVIEKSEAKHMFRDISAFTVIPLDIYNSENAFGKIDEAISCILHSKDVGKRIESQKYISSLTISVSRSGKNKSKLSQPKGFKELDLFYICAGYDFDEETLHGEGLTDEMCNIF